MFMLPGNEIHKIVTEETVSRANGGHMNIMYTGSPVKDKNGNIVGALEYVSNITELKDMQNYLTRSTSTIEAAMGKFAEGDLTVRVTPEKTDDGIGNYLMHLIMLLTKLNQCS